MISEEKTYEYKSSINSIFTKSVIQFHYSKNERHDVPITSRMINNWGYHVWTKRRQMIS